MSNQKKPRASRAPSAAQVSKNRAANELKMSVLLTVPDHDSDDPVQIDINLREFTLAEREVAKAALAKAVQPPDMHLVVVVHAWVVWRRTHPHSSLQAWMDNITFGDVLDGVGQFEAMLQVWDTTPEGFDPKR